MLRLELPYTGVPRRPGPEIPKKSQEGLPGPPGPECQKSADKVTKDPKKSQKGVNISVRRLFRHFFDTLGGQDLFEIFGDFGARGCGDSVYGDCNRKPSGTRNSKSQIAAT